MDCGHTCPFCYPKPKDPPTGTLFGLESKSPTTFRGESYDQPGIFHPILAKGNVK